METKRKSLLLISSVLIGLPLLSGVTMAATTVNLAKQPSTFLSAYITKDPGVSIKEIKRHLDFNNTLHVRFQEMYLGVPVYGADSVLHVPHAANNMSFTQLTAKRMSSDAFMNGNFYMGLAADLGNKPADVAVKKVIQKAINDYVKTNDRHAAIHSEGASLIVYIDQAQKAHWAYKVTFEVDPINDSIPAKPVFLIDAHTLTVYATWDNIQTQQVARSTEAGGGFGGNKKMGKLVYDGLAGNLAKLTVTRNTDISKCYLQNTDVIVKHYRGGAVMSYDCTAGHPEHNNVYWSGDQDKVNDGHSPSNDALFGGQVIKGMYQDWYGVPVLTESNGKPMILTMIVHARMDNAYWDGRSMTFGDGISMFYPLTSLGVAAHEVSHGFTQQHSDLDYYGQSGGMNEAFSDMAAQAAEIYAYGKNSWQIGPEIFKAPDQALRYMDKPSKDCKGGKPGNYCSIDDASQYKNGIDVHYSSGVYNRLFYLIGNSDGYDVRKAFNIMVKANQDYWTSSSTFAEGACGVLKAAVDYGYDTAAVKAALDTVKIAHTQC